MSALVAILVALLSGFVGGVAVWAASRYVVRVAQPVAVAVPVGVGIALVRLVEAAGS